MNSMTEALEWAADYAERNKLFAPVMNQRGYADGWKPPTPAEKAEIISELASIAFKADTPQSDTKQWDLVSREIDRLVVFGQKIDDYISTASTNEIESIITALQRLVERNSGG